MTERSYSRNIPVPMPLKHFTETFLILVLALLILLTGVVVDTLPLLPEGALPWALSFAVALLYALAVYPMLKQNRADYSFRVLQFLPAGMLVLWLLIQFVALKEPRLLAVHQWYTWGWSIISVLLGFLLLIAFCLNVIRRRIPRIALLLLLLVPFAAFAFASEQYFHWDNTVSSLVWQGNWWDLVGTGTFLAQNPKGNEVAMDDKNLDPSENPQEEAWRRRLRALDARRKEIAERRSSSSSAVMAEPSSVKKNSVASSVKSSSSSVEKSSARSSSSVPIIAKTPPPRLPSSGPGLGVAVISMLAGYTSVVHGRARRRNA